MNEIICPNCKKAFKVDEAGFADILKQVRDHQFDEEISERLLLAEKEKENAVKLAEANLRNSLQEALSKKDNEISAVKAKSEKELLEKLNAKESELAEMKAKIENAELVKKLAISEVTNKYEKERDDLANVLKTVELEKQNLENSLIQKYDYWHNEYYELKWTYCKYFWESHVILPEIDIADLETFIQIKADDIGW